MKNQYERFISFWETPYGPICTAAFILAVLSTFLLNITFVTFCLLLLSASPWLINFVREMELPGGFKIKIHQLNEYSEQAKQAGLFKEDDTSQAQYPYFKIFFDDPNLALAGLRIEIEKKLLKLCEIAGIQAGPNSQFKRARSIRRTCEDLKSIGYLTNQEMSLLADLMPTLNSAVHGKEVPQEAANWVITDGTKILSALDDKIKRFQNI